MLEQAASPDRLDLYVRVSRPAARLVLLALGLLAVAAVAWLLLGPSVGEP